MCNTNSKEWEARLEKGLRMWRHLQSKAQPIEEWVTAAEAVMTQDGENTDDLLTNHKVSAFILKLKRSRPLHYKYLTEDVMWGCHIAEV